jgi:hypothetical protein
MNKLLLALLAVSTSAIAENNAISDMLRIYAPPQNVIFVQPAVNPLPPAYLPPVRGQVLEPVEFGGAKLHETQLLELGN